MRTLLPHGPRPPRHSYSHPTPHAAPLISGPLEPQQHPLAPPPTSRAPTPAPPRPVQQQQEWHPRRQASTLEGPEPSWVVGSGSGGSPPRVVAGVEVGVCGLAMVTSPQALQQYFQRAVRPRLEALSR